MRTLLTSLVALMLLAGTGPAAMAMQATPAASPAAMSAFRDRISKGQVCAWPVEVGTGSSALNAAYPDMNASYFVMPYLLSPGQTLVLHGTFPFDRFSSIATYYRMLVGGHGLELLSWYTDAAITPDPGSTNPAGDPRASTDPAQRRWTIRVTGTATPSATPAVAQPVAGQNVLPAMPTGSDLQNVVGLLVFRVYVPDNANDHTGGVGLPALSLEGSSGTSHQLTPCTASESAAWTGFMAELARQIVAEAPRLPLPPGPDVAPQWIESPVPGLGQNPDNRYLMAPVAWKPGRIVVIRGKAPTFPNTRAGEPQSKATQLRYWSFNTGSNITPLATTAGISDFQIPLAADGTYTLVVSQPADKPADATEAQGVAWLKGADPSQPDLVALRHMLPSKEFFPQSVWSVPEGVIGAAENIMGPYYPQITYCDKATFEKGGADACFAGGGATPAMATPAG